MKEYLKTTLIFILEKNKNMIKIIYRNRLEMKCKYYLAKTLSIAFIMGIAKLSIVLAMKSNYREYIKEKKIELKTRFKGTPGSFSHEGACECKKILFISFETWLYFVSTLKQLLSLSASALCLVICLGYIFKKVVIK